MYLLITNGGFSIAFEGVEVFFRSACLRPTCVWRVTGSYTKTHPRKRPHVFSGRVTDLPVPGNSHPPKKKKTKQRQRVKKVAGVQHGSLMAPKVWGLTTIWEVFYFSIQPLGKSTS